MTGFIDSLCGIPYREAHSKVVSSSGALGETEAALVDVVGQIPRLAEVFTASTVIALRKESITWYGYESITWALGEQFRQLMKSKPRLRKSAKIWNSIEALCADTRLGKGRESFTMLLGQYGGPQRVPVLMTLLADPEVQGHALYALRLLGSPDGVEVAEKLLGSGRAWVRAEAKKYLRKVAPDRLRLGSCRLTCACT